MSASVGFGSIYSDSPRCPESGSSKLRCFCPTILRKLMSRRKAAEFAKQDSDVTLGRIGVRIGLPWLLKLSST
jgi:hypothetical protein